LNFNRISVNKLTMPVKPHLLHVDCLRGYAILMVIACHTAAEFADLPWRFKQLLASGWHGVQLFFLASTFTLLMSYDWEVARNGRANWGNFFVRRYLRIAPAYYVAAVIYTLMKPSHLESVAGVAGFAAFLNSWMPFKIGQSLVPGGWSISVEFSFYLVFPLIATFFHSVRRAFLLLLASIVAAIGGNELAMRFLAGHLTAEELGHFIYFSFWNQLPIFALANFVYHLAYRPVVTGQREGNIPRHGWRRIGLWFSLLSLACAAYLPLPRSFGLDALWPPNFFLSAVCMSVGCVVVASEWPQILINPWIARLGVVSFSAYLWHWMVLDVSRESGIGRWLYSCSGVAGIAAYFVALPLVTLTTYGIAFVSYHLVEARGIAWSRRIVKCLSSYACG
jgi:peptidoglycan/LPS O-acetylase OafA/YrhL